jgi:hypothetical protein
METGSYVTASATAPSLILQSYLTKLSNGTVSLTVRVCYLVGLISTRDTKPFHRGIDCRNDDQR